MDVPSPRESRRSPERAIQPPSPPAAPAPAAPKPRSSFSISSILGRPDKPSNQEEHPDSRNKDRSESKDSDTRPLHVHPIKPLEGLSPTELQGLAGHPALHPGLAPLLAAERAGLGHAKGGIPWYPWGLHPVHPGYFPFQLTEREYSFAHHFSQIFSVVSIYTIYGQKP